MLSVLWSPKVTSGLQHVWWWNTWAKDLINLSETDAAFLLPIFLSRNSKWADLRMAYRLCSHCLSSKKPRKLSQDTRQRLTLSLYFNSNLKSQYCLLFPASVKRISWLQNHKNTDNTTLCESDFSINADFYS